MCPVCCLSAFREGFHRLYSPACASDLLRSLRHIPRFVDQGTPFYDLISSPGKCARAMVGNTHVLSIQYGNCPPTMYPVAGVSQV